jgi:threonine aldolase
MPSPDGRIDLRSDTVTSPTPEMRRAMADAEVGDDVFGEDPTVNRFQDRAAELLGKEAGLYVPSGTMANQAALRALGRSGSEFVCADRAHIFRVEGESTAASGLEPVLLPDHDGLFGADALEEAFAMRSSGAISLVTIENTHAAAEGAAAGPERVRTIGATAAAHDVPVHCDGARIWNASVALGVPVRDLVGPVTTAMFCVSKGLGAPVGSVLCGPADVIGEAHAWRRRLGGAMRQAGVIAAAGLVALDTMIERLADDHRRARRLAEELAQRFPGCLEPERVQTNIVWARLDRLPARLLERLRDEGVWALALGDRARFVTHKDIDDADLERVVKILRDL